MEFSLILKVIFLSFIQGISEFFPISSSGHLVIFQEVIGFKSIPFIYDIFFHFGTLLSVIVYFFKDIREIVSGIRKRENFEFALLILIASVPTVIIGLFFKKELESLFAKPELVGYALLVTAVIIFISKFIRLKRINIYLVAFIIGTVQGIAIIPGLSRSGLTISAGLVLSMGFAFSFRFSFLLSIPAIAGALILGAGDTSLYGSQIFYLIIGAVFSAIFGFLALYLLQKIILKEKFHYFAYYCVIAGIVSMTVI